MQELETDPVRLHKIIYDYEVYTSGQMEIRDCLEKLAKQAVSNHRQLLTDLCTQKETDYPFIRLWAKKWHLSETILRERLNSARSDGLSQDTVFSNDKPSACLDSIHRQDLIMLLRESVSK